MGSDSGHTIVVSGGDPAGCSPELLSSLIQSTTDRETLRVYGPPEVRTYVETRIENKSKLTRHKWIEGSSFESEKIGSGRIGSESGSIAYESLTRALEYLSDNRTASLITLPLSKSAVQNAGHTQFRGHTEMLEKCFNRQVVMSFFGDEFNVALITRHIPLKLISDELNKSEIKKTVTIANKFYHARGHSSPEFAVLGLNPHAGENGKIGTEDSRIITPAIEELQADGIDVRGPFPADSFIPVHADEVDMIFACYHDQGLVPFKQSYFYSGIQASLGLPIDRVSPDHGVAADIAGSGEIDPTSTINCLRWLRNTSVTLPETG